MPLIFLNQLGLVLNIIGTLFVAFAFGNPLYTAEQTDSKGRKFNLAMFRHPRLFKIGVSLLVLGFILMFIATLK